MRSQGREGLVRGHGKDSRQAHARRGGDAHRVHLSPERQKRVMDANRKYFVLSLAQGWGFRAAPRFRAPLRPARPPFGAAPESREHAGERGRRPGFRKCRRWPEPKPLWGLRLQLVGISDLSSGCGWARLRQWACFRVCFGRLGGPPALWWAAPEAPWWERGWPPDRE